MNLSDSEGSEDKRSRNISSTGISSSFTKIIPKTSTSDFNVTTVNSPAPAPLLFIDHLRAESPTGDGEFSEMDKDSIGKFNLNNLGIFSNQADPQQRANDNPGDWEANIKKLSGFLDRPGRRRMWLVTDIDKSHLGNYLQLLRNYKSNKKKLHFISTPPLTRCSEQSQCGRDQVCHNGTFCTRLCRDQSQCGPRLVCRLGVCDTPSSVPSTRTGCVEDVDCPLEFVCNERNVCQREAHNCLDHLDCPEDLLCDSDTNLCLADSHHHHLDTPEVETLISDLVTKTEEESKDAEQMTEEEAIGKENMKEMKLDLSQEEENQLDPNVVGFQMKDRDGRPIIVDCGSNCQDFRKPGEKLFLDDYRLVFPVTVPASLKSSPPLVTETVPVLTTAEETSPTFPSVPTTVPSATGTTPDILATQTTSPSADGTMSRIPTMPPREIHSEFDFSI